MSVDELLTSEGRGATAAAVGTELETESRQRGKVIQVHRDDVFVELPGAIRASFRSANSPIPPSQARRSTCSSCDSMPKTVCTR